MTTPDVPFFDEFGRRVPPPGLQSAHHRQTRRWFIPVQPEIDFGAIHTRTQACLGSAGLPSATAFEQQARALLAGLWDDPRLRPVLNGVHVPFLLPKASPGDIGTTLEEVYLPALGRAFCQAWPDYRFVNHHPTGLSGKLSPAPGSRHEQLLGAMQQGPVVGWYFPCLLEYSVPASLEQMGELPGSFLLGGGFDTCAAFIGSPDLLLRKDGYPPLLWLAGLEGEHTGVGYHFEAYGYNLTFNRRAHLGQAAEYWASALVVVG